MSHPKVGILIQTEMTTNRLFKFVTNHGVPKCLQTTTVDELQLWHRRYENLNFKGLRTLKYRNMVKGIPHLTNTTEVAACGSCLIGKQHRAAIPKKSLWRSSRRLHLVHSDLCGPITPASNSDKKYILTFIDDFSRKVWIYFLSNKSDTFTFFKMFKNQVERETGEALVCLRTDRGGEFTSNEFKLFCEETGISR